MYLEQADLYSGSLGQASTPCTQRSVKSVRILQLSTELDVSYHSADPLACVRVRMPNDGRVPSLIAFAPEVNTLDLSVLYSHTGCENLRVLGERGL